MRVIENQSFQSYDISVKLCYLQTGVESPVLGVIRLHQLLVGVEQDSELSVAPDDPDGQGRGLESGPEVEGGRPHFAQLPDEEPDLAATVDADPVVDLKCHHLSLMYQKGAKRFVGHRRVDKIASSSKKTR